MVVYVDDVTAKIGASAGSHVEVTNIEAFSYREVSTQPQSVRPILVMNTIKPVGFKQAHKWYEFELVAKSEMDTALASYLKKDGTAHVTIPYCRVLVKDHSAATKEFIFDGAFPMGVDLSVRHEEDGLQTYRFIVAQMS